MERDKMPVLNIFQAKIAAIRANAIDSIIIKKDFPSALWKELVEALMTNTSLKSLVFRNEERDKQRSEDIAIVASHLLNVSPNLHSLELENCFYEGQNLDSLFDALNRNKTLLNLNLNSNHLETVSLEKILNALARNPHLVLQNIKLDENQFNNNESMTLLGNFLRENRTLKRLSLCESHPVNEYCSEKGMIAFAKALEENKGLESLTINNHFFGQLETGAFGKALSNNHTLKELNLDYCTFIGKDSVIPLALSLSNNRGLVTLSLDECKINAMGAIAIARNLEANNHLQTLRLGGNNLSDNVGLAFANMLERNNILKALDLSKGDNSESFLQQVGLVALAESLTKNKALTTLLLRFQDLDNEAANAFATSLRNNRSLEVLDISLSPDQEEFSINEYSEKTVLRLKEMIKGNLILKSLLVSADEDDTQIAINAAFTNRNKEEGEEVKEEVEEQALGHGNKPQAPVIFSGHYPNAASAAAAPYSAGSFSPLAAQASAAHCVVGSPPPPPTASFAMLQLEEPQNSGSPAAPNSPGSAQSPLGRRIVRSPRHHAKK